MANTLEKLKQNYLTATQLARAQLQSTTETPTVDSEFEQKYEHIMNTKSSNAKMQAIAHRLTGHLGELIESEQRLNDFVSRRGHRPKLQKTLDVFGRVSAISGALHSDHLQVAAALNEDCEDLAEGGIADYAENAESAENARVAYAESLSCMKKTTENLNPERYTHMSTFRQIQALVRDHKATFDDQQRALDRLERLTNLREEVLTSFARAHLHAQLAYHEKAHLLTAGVHNALLRHELTSSDEDSTVIASLAAASSSGSSS